MKKIFLLIAVFFGLSACNYNCKNNAKDQEEKKYKQIAEKNKKTTLEFFEALEKEDANALVELFAEDAVHINPYSSGLFPEGAQGKEAIREYWTPVFPNFDGMRFIVEYIYATENPNLVFIKYKGKIKLKNGAGVYDNDYYSTFKFNEAGKIIEYVEIFNPIKAARGFGMIDKIK
jgi:ketosteroid isomerase-like protein